MEVDLARHAPSKPNEVPPERAASQAVPIVLDVGDLGHPDLGAIEALCRVALEVHRCEARVCLEDASAELLELIDLAGLASVLAPSRLRGRAAERQPAGGAVSSRASARPGSR
jgi:hypothetical protein